MQIGIIVKDLEASQLVYDAIRELNRLAGQHSVCLLYQNLSPCFYPTSFALINYNKIHSSYFNKDSLLIATNTQAALDLSKAKNRAAKVFYAYELEFLDNKDFQKNYEAYTSLPIVTRSESYKQALKNYAGIEAKVAPLKVEELWTLKQ